MYLYLIYTKLNNKKFIAAVSGGPDSMALLDMLRKKGKYSLFVAHVNYQKRETAYRDETLVFWTLSY